MTAKRRRKLESQSKIVQSSSPAVASTVATAKSAVGSGVVSGRTGKWSKDSTLFAVISLCFFLSGFAALLYQMAWLRQLSIIFGTSHLAVATVLAAYMAGLAIGAAIAARLAHRVRRPILVYGVLECVIGLSAVAVPVLMLLAQQLFYAAFGGQPQPATAEGWGQSLYYLLASLVVLMIPTACMGATLPLLASHAITDNHLVGPRIGFLYGINTFGAVLGTLAAGFFLVPFWGLKGTLAVGVLVNLLVFAVVVLCFRRGTQRDDIPAPKDKAESEVVALNLEPAERNRGWTLQSWILPLMALSGAASFTYEVLWTRLLNHVFGGTIYAFAIMLASFLTGIAIGGALAGKMARDCRGSLLLMTAAQLSIAGLSWLTYLAMETLMPSGSGLLHKSMFSMAVMVPATLFIGATFPLAVRVLANSSKDSPLASGRVYAWNTFGAIAGSVLAGFVLLPQFGFGGSLKVVVSLNLLLAAASLVMLSQSYWPRRCLASAATLLLCIPVLLTMTDPGRPDKVLTALMNKKQGLGTELYYAVGTSSTVLMREANGTFELSNDGLPEASILRRGVAPSRHSQKWLAALPAIARPEAENMLVVGFGGGVTLEAVPPTITDVDVIELEKEVITANRVASPWRAVDPLSDERINIVLNDARNALSLSSKRYDIVVSQPSHPWTGGAANLYTREFMQLAKQRLNPDGVYLQWINSQYIDEHLLRVLAATTTSVFKNVRLYQPMREVLMFLCSDSDINLEQQLLSRRQQGGIGLGQHFQRLGISTAEDVASALWLDEAGVRAIAAGVEDNRDSHNLLAAFSLSDASGLKVKELSTLLRSLDPLLNRNSWLHRQLGHQLDFIYVAQQLIAAGFNERAFHLARAVADPVTQRVIDSLGFRAFGEREKAYAALDQALSIRPEHQAAGFLLSRDFFRLYAEGRSPQLVNDMIGRLAPEPAAVVQGWMLGARGNWQQLKSLEPTLAEVDIRQPWYPVATKLRVDWRLQQAQRTGDRQLGLDALEIADDMLASYWNFELFVMRAGAAYIAQKPHEFVESVWGATEIVQRKLDRAAEGKYRLSEPEAKTLRGRLSGMGRLLDTEFVEPLQQRDDEVLARVKSLLQRLKV